MCSNQEVTEKPKALFDSFVVGVCFFFVRSFHIDNVCSS